MTLYMILFVAFASFGVGVLIGRRRGTVIGIASGACVLALGSLGYFAILTLSLPM